ncbi:Uncharacterized protein DBV15_07111 [Temnothorax longispinosus]|uniref:Uncharacterized protein n=1 Tax=Temnothorax longispinosus TaxID=300112 RepID=A0A4S2KWL7_9HYME|nr:Uncharacterized protein DBV15_07111 [Temnothorax longispinosus]
MAHPTGKPHPLACQPTLANRIPVYFDSIRNGVESEWNSRRRKKNCVTYRIGMRLPNPGALAILRGNIEDATT